MTEAPKQIVINPITRLEGHGKITIFLDEQGDVSRAYLQIPELRGFENFLVGRQAEVAKKIREMVYNVFMLEDHALHLFFLGGPDFVVGPTAPKADRNVLGVIQKVGLEIGKRVIAMRKDLRAVTQELGGKVLHPVFGLQGGVAKGVTEEARQRFREVADRGFEFALFCEKLFEDVVLGNPAYVKAITSDAFTHRTHYMGLVDDRNRPNFYDGRIRVVSPTGAEVLKFPAKDYLEHIAEHVEPWTYVKFPFLKKFGWKGFVDGEASGIYSVAPLARLNVSEGMATPRATELREKFFAALGGKPVHHTLANHWARVIEIVQAAER